MAEGNEFIVGLLRNIQSGIADLGQRMDNLEARFEAVEERMAHLERRQTASMHFEQAVLAHLTGINESIDKLRTDLLGMDRRLKVVEAR